MKKQQTEIPVKEPIADSSHPIHKDIAQARASMSNEEWAQKMMDIGLMPSDTGEPGGAIVGRNMSDFIMKQGAFMQAANKLLDDKTFNLRWVDRLALPKLHEPIIVDNPVF